MGCFPGSRPPFSNSPSPPTYPPKKIPLSWGPRGSRPPFSYSPSPATYPLIFPDVSTSFLSPSYSVTRNVSTYSHHTSHTVFFKKNIFKIFWALSRGPRGSRPPFSNSPSPATYLLKKNFSKTFFKIFGGPFPAPPGLTPTIFEFPFPCYIPSNFSRRFYLISFNILLSHSRRFDLLIQTHLSMQMLFVMYSYIMLSISTVHLPLRS